MVKLWRLQALKYFSFVADDEIFKKFILTLALHLKTEEISTSCCTAIFEKSKKQLSLIHSDADNAINEFETLFRKLSKVDVS